MNLLKMLLVAVILALLPDAGQPQGKDIFVAGIGIAKCGEVLNILKADNEPPSIHFFKKIIISWMQGYLSGKNFATGMQNYIQLGSLSSDAMFDATLLSASRNERNGSLWKKDWRASTLPNSPRSGNNPSQSSFVDRPRTYNSRPILRFGLSNPHYDRMKYWGRAHHKEKLLS